MLTDCKAVATIPVSDLARARKFYVDKLGLKLLEERDEDMFFECADGTAFGVFVSEGRASGTHTQMGFASPDIDAEIEDLRSRGITFERFDMPGVEEHDGVYEMGGHKGVWFRDPEGNLLAVTQEMAVE